MRKTLPSADGVFYEEAYTSGANPVKLPPLSVEFFEPNSDKDTFENTAPTITGRVGWLQRLSNSVVGSQHKPNSFIALVHSRELWPSDGLTRWSGKAIAWT